MDSPTRVLRKPGADVASVLQTSGTTLSHLFTHTKRIEKNPITWDKKMWGNEPFTEPKKVCFSEWLCLMVRVAVVAYPRDTHLDSVRALAVRRSLRPWPRLAHFDPKPRRPAAERA